MEREELVILFPYLFLPWIMAQIDHAEKPYLRLYLDKYRSLPII